MNALEPLGAELRQHYLTCLELSRHIVIAERGKMLWDIIRAQRSASALSGSISIMFSALHPRLSTPPSFSQKVTDLILCLN